MKYPGKLFLMVLLIAIVAFDASSALSSSSQGGGSDLTSYGKDDDGDVSGKTHDPSSLETLDPATSLRGRGRFLTQAAVSRATPTCDKYPRICRAKGSPRPNCCKKKCVNVSTDRLNCGICGHKCKYSEICCKGKCVNPMSDKKHCGGCNTKCKKKGSSCVYGMCSYA